MYPVEIARQPTSRRAIVCQACWPIKPIVEFGGKIVENAARKLVDKYVPPIALIEDIDIVTVTWYEETANISGIQPQARFFVELNCSERMMQRLSTYVRIKDRDGWINKLSGWEYVPPESISATLLKILCQKL